MDGELITTIFLVGGIVLMIIETLVPGGVSFFLGLSGIIVSALRWFGILESPMGSVITWLFTSVALILAIRPLLMKYWGGDSSYKLADEDVGALARFVGVMEGVTWQDAPGGFGFRGIPGRAQTRQGRIGAG